MKIKKIFRINSNTNNESIASLLNVEFIYMENEWKIMHANIRVKNKPISCNQFYSVSVAQYRSSRERQNYHQLRLEMNKRNADLLHNGTARILE